MSMIYDNWERLVTAVLKRGDLATLSSTVRSPSICSESSDSSSSFPLSEGNSEKKEESVQETVPALVFVGGSSPAFPLKGVVLNGAQVLGKGTHGNSIFTQLLHDVKVSDNEFLARGTELVMKLLNEVEVTQEEFKQQMWFLEIVSMKMWLQGILLSQQGRRKAYIL